MTSVNHPSVIKRHHAFPVWFRPCFHEKQNITVKSCKGKFCISCGGRGEVDNHVIIYTVTSITSPSAEAGTCTSTYHSETRPLVKAPQHATHPCVYPVSCRGVLKHSSVATPQKAADVERAEGWALQRQSSSGHSVISRWSRCSIMRTWATQVPSATHCRARVQIHIEATVMGSLLWLYDAKLPRHLLTNTKPPGNAK